MASNFSGLLGDYEPVKAHPTCSICGTPVGYRDDEAGAPAPAHQRGDQALILSGTNWCPGSYLPTR